MPIQHAVWTVSDQPIQIEQGILPSEQKLEEMIVAQPRILSSEWMLIGRQEDTGHGGRIDLLAIAPDGALVLVELKRNRTPGLPTCRCRSKDGPARTPARQSRDTQRDEGRRSQAPSVRLGGHDSMPIDSVRARATEETSFRSNPARPRWCANVR